MQLQSRSTFKLSHFVTVVLAVGILIFSWLACFLWIMALTEGWGAPWDTSPVRPPLGHWQRTINDFFETGTGVYLPTVLFLTINLLSYGRTLVRTQSVRTTSLVFGVTNLITLAILIAIAIPLQIFIIHAPTHLTPDDWSYWGDFRREWPLILTAVFLFIGLLWKQPYLVRRLNQKS